MTHLSEDAAPMHRRDFWRIIGVISIGLLFYYAILLMIFYYHEFYLFDRDNPPALVAQKNALTAALREYREEHNAYPILPDNPIGDVKESLIKGGYLLPGPDADKDARYVSLNGKSFGLLLHRPGDNRCLVEVDAAKTGWWGDLPKCPF